MAPLRWNPSRVFFGWWIVAASFFISFYLGGAVIYSFTAIFEPIAKEFSWSYAQVSFAASIRGMQMSLFAPLIGILVDRWGPRRIIFSGTIIIASGLILLSFTQSLGMFYGAFVLIAMGMSCCAMAVMMTTIANWFGKKMGLASSIAISGVGFGGLLVPVLVRFIDLYDWRTVMTIIAVGILAIVLPLSLLFRHKPEQYGYLPDGQTELPATTSNVPKQAQPADIVITAKRAIKSNIFWRTLLPFTFMTIIIGAVMTHIMPYLSSVGITRSMSSFVVTAIALTTSSGQLGLGWLGDRFDKRRLLSGYFLLMGLGLICLAYSSETNVWLLIPFVVFHAIGFGNLPIMGASMVRGYFGRAHFGSIFGLQFGVGALVGMLGPYLAGWAYDNWGSYQNIWLIFSTLSIPPLALLLTLPPIRLATKLADKPGV